MLEAQDLGYRVASRWLLEGVSFLLQPGEVLAVIGPNGAGKSTLIRLLSGELPPTTGQVFLGGKPLSQLSPLAQARMRAVLPQMRHVSFPFTAWEVVMLGRLPHLNGRGEGREDLAKAEEALRLTGAYPLANRRYHSLSGGEATRVDLARVLAQSASVLIMDEPTNHLDPRHVVEVLRLLRQLTKAGSSVLIVLHDLNLAAQVADRVLLLHRGRMAALGRPHEVLSPSILEMVYDIPFMRLEVEGRLLLVPVAEVCCPS